MENRPVKRDAVAVLFALIFPTILAWFYFLTLATTGDTVVLAGKGHEGSIIVGEEKRPYDEATVARDALRALGFGS